MKLHLPKQLFTALLAAITLAAPATLSLGSSAWGAWGTDTGANTDTYYMGSTTIDALSTTDEGADSSATSKFLRAEEENTSGTITALTLQNGETFTIAGDWNSSVANFNSLTIETLNINPAADATGNGTASLVIGASQTTDAVYPTQNVTLNAINGTLSTLSIDNNATLTLSKSIVTASGKITELDLKQGGTLDLSGVTSVDIGDAATNYTYLMNRISGAGTVKLAQGLTLQTTSNKEDVTLSAHYTVAGADVADYSSTTGNSDTADLTLQSWAKSKDQWRSWNVGSSGSLTVGTNGKGVLNVLSGNRLNITGGTVTAGIIRIGHSGAANNVGSIALTDNGQLTVGNILVQGYYTEGWDNRVDLLDGTVEFTSPYAITYASDITAGIAVDVVLGGSGDETLELVAKTDWGINKHTHADSSFTIGNISVKEGNSGKITLTDATVAGNIKNDAYLTLSGSLTFTSTGGTISNTGTLDISNLSVNFTDLNSLSKSEDFSLSDGANGFVNSGSYLLISGTGSITDTGASFNAGGLVLSHTLSTDGSTLSIAPQDVYIVNTEASYDSSKIGTGKNVFVPDSGTFNSTDGSVLARTYGTGHVKLGNAGSELTASGASSFAGNLTILSGTTVKAAGHEDALGISYVYAAGKNRIITVENGAILDINGQDLYYHIILNEGATLANTGTAKSTGNRGTPYLELAGNATVHAASDFGMRYAGAETTTQSETLDLHGHTLTKTGTGSFFLYNTTVTSGTIDVQSGSLTSHGGTHNNTVIKLGSGTSFTTTSTTLNSSVIVGNGATFTANSGTYTGTSITLEDGGIFNYRTGGNHSFRKLDTGASTISAAQNASYTMTVTNASVSTGLLTKQNAGGLKYDGGVSLCKGAHVEAGTLTFNSAATISGLITVDTGATLALGTNGSVTLKGLGGFELWDTTENMAVSMPTENGYAAESTTYRIINNSGTNGLTSVSYGGASYNLTDGCITVSGENRVYYVVQSGDNKVVTGGANGVAATEFYVAESGHLVLADTVSGTSNDYSHIAGTGKLTVTFGSGTHDHHANFGNLFMGTLEVNGWTNLTGSVMRDNVVLQLGKGEHWSSGSSIINNNIKLADNGGDFVFRNSDTLVLNGIVTGEYLNIGTTGNNGTTVELTNSQNDIAHAVIGCGANTTTLKLSADMSFDSITTHTGSTVALAEGITLTLDPTEASSSTISKLRVDGTSTIHLNENATLNQFTKSGSGTVILTGSGVYDLGSSTTTNVSGLTDSENWTGTVLIQGLSGSQNPLDSIAGNLTNSKSYLKLKGVEAWLSDNQDCEQNIVLENNGTTSALKLNNGYSAIPNASFTGSISGSGDMEYTWTGGSDDDGSTIKYTISADTQGWYGKFISSSGKLGVIVDFTKKGDVFSSTTEGGGVRNNTSQELTVKVGNAEKDITFNGTIDKSTNAGAVKLNVSHNNVTFNKAVNVDELSMAQGASAQLGNTMTVGGVSFAASESATAEEPAKLTAKSDNALARLQEEASFTIEDMTLVNTTITAATTTEVKLNNVTATNTMLADGNYTLSGLNAAVGTGGNDAQAAPAGSNVSISYSTGLGVASDATLTLNLDVLGAVEQHGSGVYDITITLDGFGAEYDFTQVALAGLVKFDADSWLGKEIGNVEPVVSIADEQQVATLSDNVGAAATPSVSYTATPSVGTLVITITGLNVPEPATSTLSLLALAALAARRRRND